MRVTSKGQVTIPKAVRQCLGIEPNAEVEFREDKGRFYLAKPETKSTTSFHDLCGTATIKMSSDEIMAMTRGEN